MSDSDFRRLLVALIVCTIFAIVASLVAGCSETDRYVHNDNRTYEIFYSVSELVDACNIIEPNDEVNLDDGSTLRHNGDDCIVEVRK